MKTRKGIDEDHLTYLDAGRIAAGVRAARRSPCTAAPWRRPTPARPTGTPSRRLVEHVDIPVLGNGDIWEAGDAVRMVEQTGAAGVVVGRGCLGRPWLFRDLAAAFAGEPVATLLPRSARYAPMMRRHAELLCRAPGGGAGLQGVPQARLVVPQGLRAPAATLRHSLALVDSLAEPRRAARRPRPGRAVPGLRAGHAARPPGLAAGQGGPARGLARRRRRRRQPRPGGEQRDHRRVSRLHLTSDGEHPGESGGEIRTAPGLCA